MTQKTYQQTAYSKKLLDPRWQKKRLEIMNRDNFSCTCCGNNESTLNIHHKSYKNNPWEVDNDQLVTVCVLCHKIYEQAKKMGDFNGRIRFRQSPNGHKSYLIGVNSPHSKNTCMCIMIDDDGSFYTPRMLFTSEYISFVNSFLNETDDKEFVLNTYPSARLKYSIMMAGATVPFSFGDSEMSAWRLAKRKITENRNI